MGNLYGMGLQGGTVMTKKQKELAKKHGTPKEFAAAVVQACNDLFITLDEERVAIAKYQKEWDAAGE